MTETNETHAGTALAQVAPGALARVKDAKPWTVADLADILAGPARELPGDAPFPAPPTPVKFTDALRGALRSLPTVFGKVTPTERRKLEAAEITSLTNEINAIDEVAAQLAARRKAIQEAVRTHQDFKAEDQGLTPRCNRIADGVAKGHYLIADPGDPYETAVDGYADAWQQRYVKGKTSQSQDLLDALAAEGKITRQEYLACTRETRNLDEDKIKVLIRKNPQRGLEILAAITTRSAPGASLYAPKK
jgi:hypothetical protein